ncbi:transposase domain-containing protein [bacterium]|nr:transposase domain-containing protein [bacterium]
MAPILIHPPQLEKMHFTGRLQIDNNVAERALRRVALGRKNWLFAGSDEGGRRAAILYTMIASCQQHGVEPFAYLRDVLARIPEHLQSRIEELLPNHWHAETPRAPVSAHPTQPSNG